MSQSPSSPRPSTGLLDTIAERMSSPRIRGETSPYFATQQTQPQRTLVRSNSTPNPIRTVYNQPQSPSYRSPHQPAHPSPLAANPPTPPQSKFINQPESQERLAPFQHPQHPDILSLLNDYPLPSSPGQGQSLQLSYPISNIRFSHSSPMSSPTKQPSHHQEDRAFEQGLMPGPGVDVGLDPRQGSREMRVRFADDPSLNGSYPGSSNHQDPDHHQLPGSSTTNQMQSMEFPSASTSQQNNNVYQSSGQFQIPTVHPIPIPISSSKRERTPRTLYTPTPTSIPIPIPIPLPSFTTAPNPNSNPNQGPRYETRATSKEKEEKLANTSAGTRNKSKPKLSVSVKPPRVDVSEGVKKRSKRGVGGVSFEESDYHPGQGQGGDYDLGVGPAIATTSKSGRSGPGRGRKRKQQPEELDESENDQDISRMDSEGMDISNGQYEVDQRKKRKGPQPKAKPQSQPKSQPGVRHHTFHTQRTNPSRNQGRGRGNQSNEKPSMEPGEQQRLSPSPIPARKGGTSYVDVDEDGDDDSEEEEFDEDGDELSFDEMENNDYGGPQNYKYRTEDFEDYQERHQGQGQMKVNNDIRDRYLNQHKQGIQPGTQYHRVLPFVVAPDRYGGYQGAPGEDVWNGSGVEDVNTVEGFKVVQKATPPNRLAIAYSQVSANAVPSLFAEPLARPRRIRLVTGPSSKIKLNPPTDQEEYDNHQTLGYADDIRDTTRQGQDPQSPGSSLPSHQDLMISQLMEDVHHIRQSNEKIETALRVTEGMLGRMMNLLESAGISINTQGEGPNNQQNPASYMLGDASQGPTTSSVRRNNQMAMITEMYRDNFTFLATEARDNSQLSAFTFAQISNVFNGNGTSMSAVATPIRQQSNYNAKSPVPPLASPAIVG